MRGAKMRAKAARILALAGALAVLAGAGARAAEWHVNHETGDDGNAGTAEKPFKTFKHALTKLGGGDVLHVQKTKTPYTEPFGEIGLKSAGRNYDGTEAKPTVVEGHGAELTQMVRTEDGAWKDEGGGVWSMKPRHNVVVMGGRGHYCGFPFMFLETGSGRREFKPVAERAGLKPMEFYWCFKWEKDAEGNMVRNADYGKLYARLPEELTPATCDIYAPRCGNMVVGANNVTVRNLNFSWSTADCIDTHRGRNIIFENVTATDCLDQNISAHSTASQEVRYSYFARALAGCVLDVPLEPEPASKIRYYGCVADEGGILFKGNTASDYTVEACVMRNDTGASTGGKGYGRLTVKDCVMAWTKEGEKAWGSAMSVEGAVDFLAERCTATGRPVAVALNRASGKVEIRDCDFADSGTAVWLLCYREGELPLAKGRVKITNCRFAAGAKGRIGNRDVGIDELRAAGVEFEGCVFGGEAPAGAGSPLAGARKAEEWTKDNLREFLERKTK